MPDWNMGQGLAPAGDPNYLLTRGFLYKKKVVPLLEERIELGTKCIK